MGEITEYQRGSFYSLATAGETDVSRLLRSLSSDHVSNSLVGIARGLQQSSRRTFASMHPAAIFHGRRLAESPTSGLSFASCSLLKISGSVSALQPALH